MEYEMVEEAERDRLVGEVLDGRFEVREALSEGGMGKVYRGLQQGIDREVAIKVLQADPSGGEDTTVRRFLREARAISQLSDPNIVNFIDFGQDERHATLYLVMELIEGCELAELMENSRLDPAFVLEVGMQVCSALTEPHHQGMVHRDLKPANLMLLPRLDGSLLVKLVDFGIANSMQDQTRLTKTGVACGTPHYMAPEQIEGTEQTATIDIYGLGAIFHHMLSGEVVFEAETDVKILFKHLKERPPDLGELPVAREIPDRLCDLVHRMLAKSPSRRPESVLEVRDELQEIRREEGLESIRLDPECDPPEVFERWVLEDGAGRSAPMDRVPKTGERLSPHQTGGTSEPTEGFESEETQVDPGVREHVSTSGDASGSRRAVDSTGSGPTQLDSPAGPAVGRREDPGEASTREGGASPGGVARVAEYLPGGERFDLNLALSLIVVVGVLAGVAVWQLGGSGGPQANSGPIEIEPEGEKPSAGGREGASVGETDQEPPSQKTDRAEPGEMVIGEPTSPEGTSTGGQSNANESASAGDSDDETAGEGSGAPGEAGEGETSGSDKSRQPADEQPSGGGAVESPAASKKSEQSAGEQPEFEPVGSGEKTGSDDSESGSGGFEFKPVE